MKYKIRYVSDIHLEYGVDIKKFDGEGDILVLSGDIMSRYYEVDYDKFFELVSKGYKDIIYVMGNHEYYYGDIETEIEEIKRMLIKYKNIYVLENELKEIRGQKFYCGTMWTDFGNNPLYELVAKKGMNDFKVIRKGNRTFTPTDAKEKHKKFLEGLTPYLQEDIIVVTHHSPTLKTINDKYKGSNLNYAFASDLEGIIKGSKIRYWIHGHVHNRIKVEIGNCEVVCNAHGYEGELEDFSYKELS